MTNRSCASAPEAAQRLQALGTEIRRARGTRSQAEVAELVDRPQSSISEWERGRVELSVEQVHQLELVLGVPSGRLLLDAGYVGDGARTTGALAVADKRVQRPFRFLAEPAERFPHQVARWWGRYWALADAICVLRDSAVDDDALDALLSSQPVSLLRAGWELWEGLSAEPDQDPTRLLAGVLSDEVVARCRFALWGTPMPEPTIGPARLRLCPPVGPVEMGEPNDPDGSEPGKPMAGPRRA